MWKESAVGWIPDSTRGRESFVMRSVFQIRGGFGDRRCRLHARDAHPRDAPSIEFDDAKFVVALDHGVADDR